MDFRFLLAMVFAEIAVPFGVATWKDIQKQPLTRDGTSKLGHVRTVSDVWHVAGFNASMTAGLLLLSVVYFLLWIG